MTREKVSGERLVRARFLFESALDRKVEERSGFLAGECGEDVELREFVERLLESHESAEPFLDPPPSTATVALSQSGPNIGTKIGSYEITDKLGEGGMGTVWKGWDSLLQRQVAIKFVSDRLGGSEQAHQRFLREARSASKLSHQGIATVHMAGEHEGQVYIVFRLIDGETISERLKRGPLEVTEAFRLAREAAEALGHAHEGGVLHRDVTSRNLMVDKDGSAVIVDFGLALPEADPRITRTGSTFGTLGYMAPEVVQGKPADRRSDLYGLGVVLYEMLTGRLPFVGERAESLLYAIVNEPLEAPSERRPDLSKGVDRVLLKILAKDPAVRYQSTTELVADLQRLEAGLAPAANVTPEQSRTQLWAARNTRGSWAGFRVWILIVAGLVAISALGYYVWPRSASVQEPIRLAVLPLENYSPEPESSDFIAVGLSEALATRLGRVSALRVTPWITSRSYRPMNPLPLPDIADELGVDQLVVGTFRVQDGRVQIRLSYVDGKSGMQNWAEEFLGSDSELLDISERIASSVALNLRGELAQEETRALARNPTENEEAYRYYLQGVTYLQEGTETSTSLALPLFKKAVALDPKLAEGHVGIGAVHSIRSYFGWADEPSGDDLAETSFRTALILDPKLWSAHRGLIRSAWSRGRSEECLRIGAIAADADPNNLDALHTQADAYYFAGLTDLAEREFERVVALDPANQVAQLFLIYVSVHKASTCRQAIERCEEYLRRFGEDPEIYTWLGIAHHTLGELDNARMAYERAFELSEEDRQFWYLNLAAGFLEAERGQLAEAKAIWEQVEWSGNSRRYIKAVLKIVLQRLGRDTLRDFVGDPGAGVVSLACAHVAWNEDALNLLRESIRGGALYHQQFFLAWQSTERLRQLPEFQDYLREREALERRLREQYPPREGAES